MIGGKAKGPGAAGPSFHRVRRTGALVDRVPMDGLAHPRAQLEHGLHELPVALLLRLLLRQAAEARGLEAAALLLDALDHAAHLGEAAREVRLRGRRALTVRLVHRLPPEASGQAARSSCRSSCAIPAR